MSVIWSGIDDAHRCGGGDDGGGVATDLHPIRRCYYHMRVGRVKLL